MAGAKNQAIMARFIERQKGRLTDLNPILIKDYRTTNEYNRCS